MPLDLNRQDYVVLQKYAFGTSLIMRYQGNIQGCFDYASDNQSRIVLSDKKTPSSTFFIALLRDSRAFQKDTSISTDDLSNSFPCVPLDERIMKMITEDRMMVGMKDTASTPSAAQTQWRQ